MQHRPRLRHFTDNLLVVIGLVLVWRGLWTILDAIDLYVFAGNHYLMALPWLILGLIILYVPDKDLKELGL